MEFTEKQLLAKKWSGAVPHALEFETSNEAAASTGWQSTSTSDGLANRQCVVCVYVLCVAPVEGGLRDPGAGTGHQSQKAKTNQNSALNQVIIRLT
jgi:hypothetical protein